MKALLNLASFPVVAAFLVAPPAAAQQRAQYESLVAAHAQANNVPEALVHRVIVRESKYHPDLVGRGGTIGLMQIKLATARGVGYTGDAAGLRDPDTNLTYGVKYLAGACRAANGDHARAVRYFASGYYYVAKRQRLERLNQPGPVLASAPPRKACGAGAGGTPPMEPKEASKPAEAGRTAESSGDARPDPEEASEEARRSEAAGSAPAGRHIRCKRRKAALTRPHIGLH